VGDEACALCHGEIAKTYLQHPMARSFTPIASPSAATEKTGSFRAAGYQFLVESRGGQVFHITRRLDSDQKTVFQSEAPVSFVVGAGTRGRSYLINHDGYLFQSPVSWYTERQHWGLSPHLGGSVDPLYRPVQPQCLYCHADRFEPVENTGNHFREPIYRGQGISCERCHGPGELHVQRHHDHQPVRVQDEAIVHPGRLSPALSEAVCQQCHLQGLVRIVRRGQNLLDYRPGLPLNQFWSIFVKPTALDQQKKFSSEVEQMHASRCFRGSKSKMGCTSCHDPHETPTLESKSGYYRQRCLACHLENSCGLTLDDRQKQSPNDNCTGCHMKPRGSNLPHMASADHRIPRRPDESDNASIKVSSSEWQAELEQSPESALILFDQESSDHDAPEMARDLGLAFIDLAGLKLPARARQRLAESALPLLKSSFHAHPDDASAGQGLGYALWLIDRKQEALAALETTLAHEPRREEALVYAAAVSAQLGRTDSAIHLWRRALEVNPWSARSHFELAKLWTQSEDWINAKAETDQAVNLNPFHLETRLLRIECHLQLGNSEQARAEFDEVLRFDPGNSDALNRWFLLQKSRSKVEDRK
jgi:tetratricopeptide (TPR) repeat protein